MLGRSTFLHFWGISKYGFDKYGNLREHVTGLYNAKQGKSPLSYYHSLHLTSVTSPPSTYLGQRKMSKGMSLLGESNTWTMTKIWLLPNLGSGASTWR